MTCSLNLGSKWMQMGYHYTTVINLKVKCCFSCCLLFKELGDVWALDYWHKIVMAKWVDGIWDTSISGSKGAPSRVLSKFQRGLLGIWWIKNIIYIRSLSTTVTNLLYYPEAGDLLCLEASNVESKCHMETVLAMIHHCTEPWQHRCCTERTEPVSPGLPDLEQKRIIVRSVCRLPSLVGKAISDTPTVHLI